MADKAGKKSKSPDTRPARGRYKLENRKQRNKERKIVKHDKHLEKARMRRVIQIGDGDKPAKLPHPDPEKAAKGKTVKGLRPSERAVKVYRKRAMRERHRELDRHGKNLALGNGERQFNGNNPQHNIRHGRKIPVVPVESVR